LLGDIALERRSVAVAATLAEEFKLVPVRVRQVVEVVCKGNEISHRAKIAVLGGGARVEIMSDDSVFGPSESFDGQRSRVAIYAGPPESLALRPVEPQDDPVGMAGLGKLIATIFMRGIARFEITSEDHVRAAFRRRDDQGRRPVGFYRVRRDLSMFFSCVLVVPCSLVVGLVGLPPAGQTNWLEVVLIAVLCVPPLYLAVRTFFERPLPFPD
jgi:hypothetical protein